MDSDDESPLFAFHDLDYIPYGVGGSTAPYIETPAATMRAAAALMRLAGGGAEEASTIQEPEATTVVCDLGCGDGDFLIGLLAHIKTLTHRAAAGVGVDYDAELIKSAGRKAGLAGVEARWLVYDFNEDRDDLVGQLLAAAQQVTHVFVYLVPKQLALRTVRRILTRLCKSGVVVCCYKFHPMYLTPVRRDEVMELVVFDETS